MTLNAQDRRDLLVYLIALLAFVPALLLGFHFGQEAGRSYAAYEILDLSHQVRLASAKQDSLDAIFRRNGCAWISPELIARPMKSRTGTGRP